MAPANDQSPDNAAHVSRIETPPTSIRGILARLGPGLIIAGSIVGSGELIATTKTGAEAGFTLLWLILIGCVIKVFAQVELGRFTIAEGRGTMDALNLVPGPRARVSWLVWCWLLMFSCSIGQLGGIVGSVGQAMAISFPLTGDLNEQLGILKQQADFDILVNEGLAAAELPSDGSTDTTHQSVQRSLVISGVKEKLGERPDLPEQLRYTYDDVYWSAIITVFTAVLLVLGRYGLIQNVSTFLVAGFTMVTVFSVISLQSQEAWRIHWDDLVEGLSFNLPPSGAGRTALATGLATLGIIGVGATELIAYPYFCLEKGYARFTGPREQGRKWGERANGWMRVMRWDAWCSMVIYTFATVAFYFLGAAVLNRAGRNPSDALLVPTLIEMYRPVWGSWAQPVFVFGAFAVLYSTFFVATAGHARVASDALQIFRGPKANEAAYRRSVMILSGVLPFVSLTIYMASKKPTTLVFIGAFAQATMLPLLGGAAVYFRYRRCDPRLTPGRLWSAFLWLSFFGLLITGVWGAWENLQKVAATVSKLFS